MSTFSVNRDGETLGEFSAEQIEEALEQGSLTAQDLVWSEDVGDWVTIAEAFEISVEETDHTVDLDHVPEDVVESAGEVDAWDAAFDDPNANSEEEAAPVDMTVSTPKRSSFAAGWVLLGLLAVGSLVAAALILPAMQKVQESAQLAAPTKTARAIMRAVLHHASNHQSTLPASLDKADADSGMPPAAERNTKPTDAVGEAGFNYLGAGLKSDGPGDTIILESRWLTRGKQAVIGYANGNVEVRKAE
jgi:hypothetical protein